MAYTRDVAVHRPAESRWGVIQVRIAVKVSNRRFVMLDADAIYYLESEGHDVLVRTARKRRHRSVRRLGDLEKKLNPRGFVRVHRSFVVNPNRVREARMQRGSDNEWELKLDPPVNAVLPVGRAYLARSRQALGF